MTARKIRNPGNPFIERWEVEGSRGDIWIVSKRQDGTFACSCPAWKFHKAPKPACKHILATLDGIEAPVMVPQRPNDETPTVGIERFTVRRKIREE